METVAKLALGAPFLAAVALFGQRALEPHQIRSIRPAPVVAAHGDNVLAGTPVVIDGDTLRLGDRRIRLFGIDAPERRQTCKKGGQDYACGTAATEALRALIGPREVSCAQRDTDRYGRAVAVCSAGSGDVGGSLVRQGWAIAYRSYSLDYVGQEDEARQARRGMWAGDFVSPSEWRHQN